MANKACNRRLRSGLRLVAKKPHQMSHLLWELCRLLWKDPEIAQLTSVPDATVQSDWFFRVVSGSSVYWRAKDDRRSTYFKLRGGFTALIMTLSKTVADMTEAFAWLLSAYGARRKTAEERAEEKSPLV